MLAQARRGGGGHGPPMPPPPPLLESAPGFVQIYADGLLTLCCTSMTSHCTYVTKFSDTPAYYVSIEVSTSSW